MLKIAEYFIANKFCKNCEKCDTKRDEGLTVPDDIDVYKDLEYGPKKGINILDVYRPKNVEGKLPVLISIHGGGYVYGDKELYSFYTMMMAQNGFVAVNFSYSLAPKYKFPTITNETNEVLKWVVANKDKYGFDTDNVVMIGDSAGAQLVSQYAVCVTNPDYAKVMKLDIPDFKLKALSLGCGIYKINNDSRLARSFEKIYFTSKPYQFGEMIKPLDYITDKYPPTYLLSSPGDYLFENMEPMAELLRSKGVEAEYKSYGGKDTYHVFFLDIRSDLAKECNKDQVDFLKKHLG